MNNLSSVDGASVQSAAGLAVAKTTLDQAEKQGGQMVDLIKSADGSGGGPRGAVSAAPGSGETGGGLDLKG